MQLLLAARTIPSRHFTEYQNTAARRFSRSATPRPTAIYICFDSGRIVLGEGESLDHPRQALEEPTHPLNGLHIHHRGSDSPSPCIVLQLRKRFRINRRPSSCTEHPPNDSPSSPLCPRAWGGSAAPTDPGTPPPLPLPPPLKHSPRRLPRRRRRRRRLQLLPVPQPTPLGQHPPLPWSLASIKICNVPFPFL